jgi:hypothetical protein
VIDALRDEFPAASKARTESWYRFLQRSPETVNLVLDVLPASFPFRKSR